MIQSPMSPHRLHLLPSKCSMLSNIALDNHILFSVFALPLSCSKCLWWVMPIPVQFSQLSDSLYAVPLLFALVCSLSLCASLSVVLPGTKTLRHNNNQQQGTSITYWFFNVAVRHTVVTLYLKKRLFALFCGPTLQQCFVSFASLLVRSRTIALLRLNKQKKKKKKNCIFDRFLAVFGHFCHFWSFLAVFGRFWKKKCLKSCHIPVSHDLLQWQHCTL